MDTERALELLGKQNYRRVTERVREAVVTIATNVSQSLLEHDLTQLEVPGYGRLRANVTRQWNNAHLADFYVDCWDALYWNDSDGNLCLLTDRHRFGDSSDHAATRDEVVDFALHLEPILESLRKAVETREDTANRAAATVGIRDE